MEKIYDAQSTPPPLPPIQFHYTLAQFNQLEVASEVCTYLSMIAIALVVAVYWYMLYYHPRDANRVSLRCVIAANLVSFLDHCLALKAAHDALDTSFCASFRFLNGLFTVLPSCLLGLVGVHLFLVFVCKIHWPCRPEYILMPVAVVYTVIANVIPYFAENLPEGFAEIIKLNRPVCWYYNAFLDRTYNQSAWIYYYSFMFFIIVVAFFSSISAMIKVYLDKKKCQERMLQITSRGISHLTTGEPSPSERSSPVPNPHSLRNVRQQNTNPFTKVVARSLLYPLMPALTYSLGFALQMHLIDPLHTADFAFSMVSGVLARLAGVFTAMIFFADPTVQTIPREVWEKCKKRLARPSSTLHTRPTSSVLPSTTPSVAVSADPTTMHPI